MCEEFLTYLIYSVDNLNEVIDIAEDQKINLMDFGCVRIFDSSFVTGVIELYYALLSDDRDRAVNAYEIWGFKNISHEVMDVLNIWAEFVYAPLLRDKVQKIQEKKK